MDAILVAIQLITVTMIDGRVVTINPAQVTRLSEANRDLSVGDHLLPDAVKCVIFFTDGAYLSIAESCMEVTNRWLGVKP